MPIHLSPISRREFVRRSLFASIAFATVPRCFAAGRKTDADSFALLSDTHIAADPNHAERGINMTEHFKAVALQLLKARRNPAGIFVVGDCAFRDGQPGDYSALVKLMEPLRAAGMTLHLALGNHDDRGNFLAAVNSSSSLNVANHQVSLVRSDRCNWFILDSLEKTLQTPGLLGAEQLAWLAKTLDENSARLAMVLVHHNPGKDGAIGGLKDTQDLFDVIRPRKQVKALIYGHTHDWKVTQDQSGIHLINLPPVAYPFKEGNPSGWVEVEMGRSGMDLELRCVDPQHPLHGQEVKLKWRK